MTQDNDDLLNQVFAGMPTIDPVQSLNETGNHVNSDHKSHESEHIIHTESYSYHEEHNHESEQQIFVHETTNQQTEASHPHGHDEHVSEHHHEQTIEQYLNEPSHFEEAINDDQQSTVSTVRSVVSNATSVSVHSSVSQKSAQQHYVEEKQAELPWQQLEQTHSVASTKSKSTVKESANSSTHSHLSEKTVETASTVSSSSDSQATTINKYKVNNDEESEPGTPIAVQRSSQHDALIKQFITLHPREPSVVSSAVTPSQLSDGYSSDETEVVMPVKYTQYAFDSDKVEQEKVVVSEVQSHDHVHHAAEHTNGVDSLDHLERSSEFDEVIAHREHTVEPVDHHQTYQHNFNRRESDESFQFEVAEFVNKDHNDEHSENEHGEHHSVVHDSHAPVEESTVFQHNYSFDHNPPPLPSTAPPLPVEESSSSVSSLSDYNADHHHHEHHVGLIPSVGGPRVREDLRPVTLSNLHEETSHKTTYRSPISAPVAHVAPVTHVSHDQHTPKISHTERLTPMVDPSAFVHKHTHHTSEGAVIQAEHHYEQAKHDHQESTYHEEPYEEEFVGVKNLRALFDQGAPVEINYNVQKVHGRKNVVDEGMEEHHYTHGDHVEHVHTHDVLHNAPAKEAQEYQNISRRESKSTVYSHQHVEPFHDTHEIVEEVHHTEVVEHEPSNHHDIHEEAVHEEQLPVSEILGLFGGGIRLRRPDHIEDISKNHRHHHHEKVNVDNHEIDVETKSRTVTQSSMARSDVHEHYYRSHSSTINAERKPSLVSPAAPISENRHSSSSQFQSVRVVKNVRAFISEWGRKDFVPPSSPVITVPRMPNPPSARNNLGSVFPQPTSRKSTVVSSVSQVTKGTQPEHHSEIQSRRESVTSVATTATSRTMMSEIAKAVEEHLQEEPVEQYEEHLKEKEEEEFVFTPVSQRRANFERNSRGYSINRKTHGELRPMVNVLTD